MSHGFVILSVANVGLNPHGWWLYVPNVELIMSKMVSIACKIEPSKCNMYVNNLKTEFHNIESILVQCIPRTRGLRVITMVPGETYPVLNFGVNVVHVVQTKGVHTSLTELSKVKKLLKGVDAIVVSEFSEKLPITKIVLKEAKKLDVPVIKINILWETPSTFSNYLRDVCDQLLKVK